MRDLSRGLGLALFRARGQELLALLRRYEVTAGEGEGGRGLSVLSIYLGPCRGEEAFPCYLSIQHPYLGPCLAPYQSRS